MGRKTGIISFHRADNLGAVLQAYALQRTLTDVFGCDTEIIDYRCPKIENDKKQASGLKKFALQVYYAIKHSAFEGFRNRYLNVSQRFDPQTVGQCGSSYDLFITGSDQVWNYECSGWDDAYFLSFVEAGKKKCAYAASLGRYEFTPEEQVHVKELLQDFSCISLREDAAKQTLQKLGVENTLVCADPVVLLTKDQWLQITPPRRCKDKYVFVYMIMNSEKVLQEAKAYAKKHNCKVICNKTSPEFILRGSPRDFLSWIYHAECVFTNSFHGTSFSLILEKPLAADITYPDGAVNGRVYEMLERTNALQCALESNLEQAHIPNEHTALDKMRLYAYRYLEQICKDLN